jgi:hypothetical protein
MSSDSIHDAVLCAEGRGRTPARSIDAAIVKEQHTAAIADRLMVFTATIRESIEIPPYRMSFAETLVEDCGNLPNRGILSLLGE